MIARSCLIAVGSNLGDRLANLRAGLTLLAACDDVTIHAVSNLYETAPVGGPANQGAYLNAAIAIETVLPPGELLALLHRIEAECERTREVRWGPRTLDLDLLTYADVKSDVSDLLIPHPRMHQRRFVMVPVCDIAAETVHPALKLSMRELCSRLRVEDGDLKCVAQTWWTAPDKEKTE